MATWAFDPYKSCVKQIAKLVSQDQIFVLGGWDITMTYLSDVIKYSVDPTTGALTKDPAFR